MGYTEYTVGNLEDVVRDLLKPFASAGGENRVLASMKIGHDLWTVRAIVRDGVEVERYICHYHVDGRTRSHGPGYRGETESCGPRETNCPLAFFDLVPEPPNEYAREFRERCIQEAAYNKRLRTYVASLKPGDTIVFRQAAHTFVKMHGRSIIATDDEEGKRWRIPPRYFDGIEVPPEPTPAPTPNVAASPTTVQLAFA